MVKSYEGTETSLLKEAKIIVQLMTVFAVLVSGIWAVADFVGDALGK